MKKNNVILAATGLLAIALVAGCEWSGGGSATYFSDRYNWVSFNGVYRPVPPNPLISDYDQNPGGDIYSFTVIQEGERLTINDNNGAVYTGTLSRVVTNAGSSQDTPQGELRPVEGSEVTAHFSVTGRSAANQNVRMTGIFQGVVTVSTNNLVTITDRIITGTWLELPNGKTGDVYGEAM